MDLVRLFALCLCCSTAAARYVWTDKPWLIFSDDDITEGQTVEVSCTLPIDNRGGDCRLFRGDSDVPFRLKTALDYICVFHLSSQVLLGNNPVGSDVVLRCDYTLQDYTSRSSDRRVITVWGSRPSPRLSVSHHFLSPDDSVEVTCVPPLGPASSCHFHRDGARVAEGACHRNLTGRQLSVWEKPSVVLAVNLTCRYRPHQHLHIRSEPSNQSLLLVVDVSGVSSSSHCEISVSVADEQLETLGQNRSWTFAGSHGAKVKVHVTNSSLTPNQSNDTCGYRH